MTKNQKIALGLVGAAVAALLFCAFTKEWFSIGEGEGRAKVGLRSVTGCQTSWSTGELECKTESLAESLKHQRKTDDTLDTWLSASEFTFFGALLSVCALLCVGVLGFTRHDKVGLAGKVTLLVIITTILGSIFVLAKRPPYLNASWGVFLFMAGGLAGVAGAYMLGNPATYEEVERDPSIPRL